MASFNSNINNTDSSSPESRFGISGNTGNVNHKRKSSGSLVLVVVLIIGCIGAILVVPFIIAIIAIVIVLSQPSEEIYETRDNVIIERPLDEHRVIFIADAYYDEIPSCADLEILIKRLNGSARIDSSYQMDNGYPYCSFVIGDESYYMTVTEVLEDAYAGEFYSRKYILDTDYWVKKGKELLYKHPDIDSVEAYKDNLGINVILSRGTSYSDMERIYDDCIVLKEELKRIGYPYEIDAWFYSETGEFIGSTTGGGLNIENKSKLLPIVEENLRG